MERKKRGDLLSQKSSQLFANLLANVQLTPPETYIKFDDIIQIWSSEKPSFCEAPLALSLVVNEANINRCQEIDESSYVTCAPSIKSVVRNSFFIRRPNVRRNNYSKLSDNSKKLAENRDDDKYLKYGQEFYLECYESKSKPLLIYSSPKSPLDQNPNYIFKANGEVKQSVGLSLQQNLQTTNSINETDDSNTHTNISYCLWQCYHTNPDMRYETIGDYIPVC